MKYVVTINDKSYEVEVEKGIAQLTKVAQAVNAPAAVAPAPAPSAAPAAAPAHKHVTADEGFEVIESPMPGVIVDIKVDSGSKVKRGDTLLVLEAMKMENEITAPRDGEVAQILAAKGAAVGTGTPLLTLS